MECGGGCQICICNLNLQLCTSRPVYSSEMANFTREDVEAAILSSYTTIGAANLNSEDMQTERSLRAR